MCLTTPCLSRMLSVLLGSPPFQADNQTLNSPAPLMEEGLPSSHTIIVHNERLARTEWLSYS